MKNWMKRCYEHEEVRKKGKKEIGLTIRSRGLTRDESEIVYKAVRQAIQKIRYERKRTDMEPLSYLIKLE